MRCDVATQTNLLARSPQLIELRNRAHETRRMLRHSAGAVLAERKLEIELLARSIVLANARTHIKKLAAEQQHNRQSSCVVIEIIVPLCATVVPDRRASSLKHYHTSQIMMALVGRQGGSCRSHMHSQTLPTIGERKCNYAQQKLNQIDWFVSIRCDCSA